jgi:hypothetical protein
MYLGYKKKKMGTDRESGRGNKRARVCFLYTYLILFYHSCNFCNSYHNVVLPFAVLGFHYPLVTLAVLVSLIPSLFSCP